MLDISPRLLAKQKELLQRFAVNFWEMDILQIPVSALVSFDLVIMNENLGDLPALVIDQANRLPSAEELSSRHRADYFINKYQLNFYDIFIIM